MFKLSFSVLFIADRIFYILHSDVLWVWILEGTKKFLTFFDVFIFGVTFLALILIKSFNFFFTKNNILFELKAYISKVLDLFLHFGIKP